MLPDASGIIRMIYEWHMFPGLDEPVLRVFRSFTTSHNGKLGSGSSRS